MFLYVAGGQQRGTGITQYTQQQITDGLNELIAHQGGKPISRSTVNRAVRALVGFKWIEQLGNGLFQLNVRLWFHGNSNAQHAVLEQLAVQHERDPDAFPHGIGPDIQEELDLDFTEDSRFGAGRRTG